MDTTDEGEDAEELARGERERVEAEADELLRRGPTKEKYRADDVTFRPAKSWMGNDRAEKVGRWRAEVWDAAGKMTKRRVTRLGEFRVDGSFSEYLESASRGAADAVETTPVEEFHEEIHEEIHEEGEEGEEDEVNDDEVNDDEVNDDEVNDDEVNDDGPRAASGTKASNPSSRKRPAYLLPSPVPRRDPTPPRLVPRRRGSVVARGERRSRRNRGRCRRGVGSRGISPSTGRRWSPILDVMSHANKHLKKVKRLVEYWRGAHGDAFPVKVQVPIVMTAYVTVDFRDFATLDTHDESVPTIRSAGFFRRSEGVRDEISASRAERRGGGGAEAPRGGGGGATRRARATRERGGGETATKRVRRRGERTHRGTNISRRRYARRRVDAPRASERADGRSRTSPGATNGRVV